MLLVKMNERRSDLNHNFNHNFRESPRKMR